MDLVCGAQSDNVPIRLDTPLTPLPALFIKTNSSTESSSKENCELSKVTRTVSLERHLADNLHCFGVHAEISEMDISQTGNQYSHDCIMSVLLHLSLHISLKLIYNTTGEDLIKLLYKSNSRNGKNYQQCDYIIKTFKGFASYSSHRTLRLFAAVPKETRLAAQRVSRKDKFTDDRELWPHAISRHQSGDSTILGLRKA